MAANWNDAGQCYLAVAQVSNLHAVYLDCVEQDVREFLEEHGLTPAAFRILLPPQVSTQFVSQVADRLGFPADAVVDVATEGRDLASSSTPVAMQAALEGGRAKKGDRGLIVNVGSGVQVACAIYQF